MTTLTSSYPTSHTLNVVPDALGLMVQGAQETSAVVASSAVAAASMPGSVGIAEGSFRPTFTPTIRKSDASSTEATAGSTGSVAFHQFRTSLNWSMGYTD